MSPEPAPPDIAAPPESYPFWGYPDLLGFILIALLGSLVVSLLAALIPTAHVKRIYVLMPAQVLLYAFLLGALAVIFRRYYGRPFWLSLRWVTAELSTPFVAACGVLVAFAVMVASVLMRTPDIDSPMKALLSDPTSVVMIAVIGTTLAPVCEEIVFRGFLQPLLVCSLGETQHLHKPSVIGRMDEKNVIWPLWISDTLIAPEPWSRWLPKDAGTGRELTLKRAV